MIGGSNIDPDAQELALGQVADEVNDGLRHGIEPDVEQLARDHPAIAAQIRQLVPALVLLHHVGSDDESDETAEHRATMPACSGQIGDYRIVREIGRGGMGIVYEAEQISLGRRVALKILPFAAVLDPRQLQRFKNEAQAAAALHHPNIVAVYGVGCERGVHYYAMQFVDGQALDQVVRLARAQTTQDASGARAGFSSLGSDTVPEAKALLSTEQPSSRIRMRGIARLAAQVAEALEHAHAEGVVHRDIKPSNLIVDAHGKIWVTDFGLARRENAGTLTRTGDVVGTLRYMSPELALGQRAAVTHRTDIYSLGATLYELITLEPVFAGEDRQELLRQIAFEEPRPPRRISPDTPHELETIVLKALAKSPDERYASALDLADDLKRFLDDRPIQAKRPTVAQRAWKLARRHRRVAWAAGACAAGVVVLAVVGLTISNVMISRERDARTAALVEKARALTEVETERQAAEDARADAIANLKTARQAVDQMLTRVATDGLANAPHMEQVRRQLLEDALAFYQTLYREHSNDMELRVEVALARGRVGSIQAALGQPLLAEQSLRGAIAELQELSGMTPLDAFARGYLDGFHATLASILWNLRRWDEAIAEGRRALELAQQLAADYPDLRRNDRLADRFIGLGQFLILGQPEQAKELFRQAIGIAGGDRDRAVSARAHLGLASAYLYTERWLEAEQSSRAALDIWRSLVDDNPTNYSNRSCLADALYNCGFVLARNDKPAEAEQLYREALTLAQQLVAEFPSVPGHWTVLANLHYGLANVFESLDPERNVEHLRQALEIYERIVVEFPTVPGHWTTLASLHHALANAFKPVDQNRAVEHLRQAVAIYERLATEFPSTLEWQDSLRHRYFDAGQVLAAIGRTDEAAEAIGKAASLQEQLGGRSGDPFVYWWELARSHVELGRMFAQSDRSHEADAEFRKAVVIAEKLEADFGAKPEYRDGLSTTQYRIGHVLGRAGRPHDALAVTRLAVPHLQKLTLDAPDVARHRELLAGCYRRIGMSQASLGRATEAEAAYREAIARGADGTGIWASLAAAQLALGDMDGYRTSCAKLLENFDQNELWRDANTVAWFCVLVPDSGVPFDRVVHVAEQALTREDPHSTTYRRDALHTLGVALYRAGRYEQSIARIHESIAAHAQGGNAWDWLFLAMSHARLDQADEARKWYDRSLEWIQQNESRIQKNRTTWDELGRFRTEARKVLKLDPAPDESGSHVQSPR